MKQELRSKLPPALADRLDGCRFAMLQEKKWGLPVILAAGNDPRVVALGGVAPECEADGTPKPPHKLDTTGNVTLADGVLYRIDD